MSSTHSQPFDHEHHAHGAHAGGGGGGGGAGHGGHGPGVPAAWLRPENIELPRGWGMPLTLVLGLIGLVCIGLTLAYPMLTGAGAEAAAPATVAAGEAAHAHSPADNAWKLALHSYHAGAMVPFGMAIGSLGLLLIFRLVNAGWVASIRRPLEAAASLVPLVLLLIAPTLLIEFAFSERTGALFHWRDPALRASDHLLQHKSGFLNDGFFLARLAVYFGVWTYLAYRLTSVSRRQDAAPNPALTARLGRTSAWGILVYALCVAFAGFDLLMGLDYHWFSTMFGVYTFAGAIFVSLALWALTLNVLAAGGRMQGFLTDEHRHDVGKLQIAFVIFWAYIAFSQYFLIWYANIPEETAWVLLRGGGSAKNEWTTVFWILALGHFIAPFLFLLWRDTKRRAVLLSLGCAWLILMHMVDMFWIVRPEVYKHEVMGLHDGVPVMGKIGLEWVDITGILGPVCLFLAVYVRRLASAKLVPINDPFMGEASHHKNYV